MEKLYKTNNEAIEAVNDGRDIPSKVGDSKEFRVKYIRTDGWRGYYQAKVIKSKASGWELYNGKTAGWVTGNWDDAGSNASDTVEDELDQIAAKTKEAGREMLVIFLPSSNVFSTIYDIFTRPLIK